MVSWLISRIVVLTFGTLYPAYSSYKAIKSKDVKEYVRWMMYWIVYALFITAETLTDIFISWIPFYYELKMSFVIWLLSPYTRGASLLYRKFVHPALSRREKEIDEYIVQAKERGYETMVNFGKRGLNIAATAAVQAASRSQDAIAGRLRSFSMQDLRNLPDDEPLYYRSPTRNDDMNLRRRPLSASRTYESSSVAPQYVDDSDSLEERHSDPEVARGSGWVSTMEKLSSKPTKRQGLKKRTQSLTRATRSRLKKKTADPAFDDLRD
ncbi:receptor expression-enhancing protein 1-like [Protopterus annectens]|uniref:receptor expression-enhancing protein 1-like n=1 Tax=Protopterus annectens TaxID=7888 RepID=UPI001CFA25F2|nr:receptor expression-enhancing protein 1-like [Protopterus annectens]